MFSDLKIKKVAASHVQSARYQNISEILGELLPLAEK
jgi:hypothetical protein